jgi:hypothetical protein
VTHNMRSVIEPRSDQLNADSLLAGQITITITEVSIRPGTEQPITINYDGDGGRPYKPCKSMARVLVTCWGPDASKYIGRSMTLYCDPKVTWGGLAVGGIRVSHLSHITAVQTMALTATKGNKKAFTVKPLAEERKKGPTVTEWLDDLHAAMTEALASSDPETAVQAVLDRPDVMNAQEKLTGAAQERLGAVLQLGTDFLESIS